MKKTLNNLANIEGKVYLLLLNCLLTFNKCFTKTFLGGVGKGVCGCCDVCNKVLGEECGGTFNTAGRCDEGLYCYIRGDPNNDVGTCGKSKTHNFH